MPKISEESINRMCVPGAQKARADWVSALNDAGYDAVLGDDGHGITITDIEGGGAELAFEGSTVQIVSSLGNTYHLRFNGAGDLIELRDPAAFEICLDYDDKACLKALHRGEHSHFRLAYDAHGRLISITYPDDSIYQLERDDGGQICALTDRGGHTYRFSRNGSGHPQIFTDAAGHQTTYRYNDDGALVSVVEPTGDQTRYAWSEDRQCLQVFRNGLSEVCAQFNLENGCRRIHFSDGSFIQQRFKDGYLVEVKTEDSLIELAYDDAGRLCSETVDGQVLTYAYSPLGHLTGITTADGIELIYAYNDEGRLSAVKGWDGTCIRMTRAANGMLGALHYPNGVTVYHHRNPLGLLQGLRLNSPASKKSLIDCKWEYDRCDRVIFESTNGIASSYHYDDAGRLVRINGHQENESYDLDALGNRVLQNGVSNHFDASNQLKSWADTPITYDKRGHLATGMTAVGAVEYEFNGRGQLIRLRGPQGDAEYRYDALGRRIQKVFQGVTTRFQWAGSQLISEERIDGAHKIKTDYLICPQLGAPLALRRNGSVHAIHLGRRLEPLALTNTLGAITWRAKYLASGACADTTGNLPQNLRLPGQYFDEESGLHYNVGRYYNPLTGRFLTRDPRGFSGGSFNLYAYCDGDPLHRSDPTGELAFLAAVAIGAAVGAAIGAGMEIYRQSKTQDEMDWGAVGKEALIGGAVGAIGAAVGVALAPAAAALGTGLQAVVAGGAVVGGVTSIVETCAEAKLRGESVSAEELLWNGTIGATIGAVTAGIGGMLANRGKRLVSETTEALSEAQERSRATLNQHLDAVDAHEAKYAERLREMEADAQYTARQKGGIKAKITEAKGERAAANHMADHYPDHEMVRGFEVGTGFDQVYIKRDANGVVEEIIIVEAKGPGAKLSTGAKKGDQMSQEWIENTVAQMDPENNELAQMIDDALLEGPPPTVKGKVIEAGEDGGAIEHPTSAIPGDGAYN